MATENTPLSEITPEQFAQLVKGASEAEIKDVVRSSGTGPVLTRVFEGMQQRFRADQARGVTAKVQFVIEDEGPHEYFVDFNDGSCRTGAGTIDEPRVTLRLGLVPFLRLISGQAQGPQLFMTGQLKIAGDLMFAPRIMNFFDVPRA